MTPITSFNRQNLRDLDAAIKAALQTVTDKYGVSFKMGAGRFSTSSYRTTLEVAPAAASGEVIDIAERDFRRYATAFGLQPDDYGKVTTISGKRYQIVGIKPAATTYPITAKYLATGTVYKFPADSVLRGLGRQTVTPCTCVSEGPSFCSRHNPNRIAGFIDHLHDYGEFAERA